MESPGADPSVTDVFHRGVALMQLQRFDEAERAFFDALDRDPGLAEAHLNIGWMRQRQHQDAEAEAAYRRACEIDSLCVQAYLNLGELLLAQKRFAEAEQCHRHAWAIDPHSPSALSALGKLLACTYREKEAEACYRAALSLDPSYRKASFNLAYLLLRQGRLQEGWARLEARESCVRATAMLPFPRWQGEPLHGRSILIAAEAGYGDMIQFCRYAEALKKRGAGKVGVLCHAPLRALLAGLNGVDVAIDMADVSADAWQGWDCWILPMSLPFVFGTEEQTIPATLPYLSTDPARVRYWSEKLLPRLRDERRVGLAWKGNPLHENDADRSLPSLHELMPLSTVPNMRFVSLQKGAGEDHAIAPPFAIDNSTSQIRDFADTAAIIEQLDLVVTVDTAVAHLAGALGKPCWVLLPHCMADWRWMKARDDSPWYPDVMRLFRQRRIGEWDSVIANVRDALAAWRAAV